MGSCIKDSISHELISPINFNQKTWTYHALRGVKRLCQHCSEKGVKCYFLHILFASSDWLNFVVRSRMSDVEVNLVFFLYYWQNEERIQRYFEFRVNFACSQESLSTLQMTTFDKEMKKHREPNCVTFPELVCFLNHSLHEKIVQLMKLIIKV